MKFLFAVTFHNNFVLINMDIFNAKKPKNSTVTVYSSHGRRCGVLIPVRS